MENLSEYLGVVIVLLPVLIFVITMLVIQKSLKKQQVKLSDLLMETDVSATKTDKAEGANAPVKRSASRLILFLSGVTSLILSVCITTYYFYMNIYCINCTHDLDLSDFTNVLLALGIGVVPYSVNQVKKIRL